MANFWSKAITQPETLLLMRMMYLLAILELLIRKLCRIDVRRSYRGRDHTSDLCISKLTMR